MKNSMRNVLFILMFCLIAQFGSSQEQRSGNKNWFPKYDFNPASFQKPAPEFEEWLLKMNIFDEKMRLKSGDVKLIEAMGL